MTQKKTSAQTEKIVRYLGKLDDGSHIVEHADGTIQRERSKTDWARFDALTDEDIAKAVAEDPDAPPIDLDWSDAVLIIPTKKKPISIRLDEDVLAFFRSEGEGYQRRINAVLRSYMEHKSKAKKRA